VGWLPLVTGAKLYWADANTQKIQRGNLDGSGTPEDLFDNATDSLGAPRGVALDLSAGMIYWSDTVTQKIQRGNLDGTGSPEDLFDNPTDGVVGPHYIELDLTASKIYWADPNGSTIQRGNMDGFGSIEILFDNATDGLVSPWGVGLDLRTPAEIELLDGASAIPDGGGPIDFGNTIQGQSNLVKTFTVNNIGGTTLSTSGLSVPTGYSVTEVLSGSIVSAGSDTFEISLSTATVGTFPGTISFTNSDADENPYNFTVTGTVSAPPLPTSSFSGLALFVFSFALVGLGVILRKRKDAALVNSVGSIDGADFR